MNSIDRALSNAGIGDLNLVKVSSILPPGANYHNQHEILAGTVTYAALAVKTSTTAGEMICAAVAAAVPENLREPGILMEGCYVDSKLHAEQSVIGMAEIAMSDRNIVVKEIKSISVECLVVDYSSVVAAVILW